MLICTAEDGRTFRNQITLYEVAGRGSLKAFLSEITGVDPASIICFLSDGQQLTDANIRQLAGSPEDTLYVFNREFLFLDTELADVIRDLEIPLEIRPLLEETASADAILASAQDHLAYIPIILSSLSVQTSAIQVAAANLDSHILNISEIFENFEAIASKELDRQAALLRNHHLDLEIISKIRVHHEFLSPNVRRDVEAGLKERMLVDYISSQKMTLVAESCSKIHDDLTMRFQSVQASMTTLTTGADDVRISATSQFRDDCDVIHRRAISTLSKLRELHGAVSNNSPSSSTVLTDMMALELSIRREVEDINDIKNQSTAHVMTILRQVSFLQSTIAETTAALTSLDTDVRNKGGFIHMQRLHNMVYMYGATIVEIVRRKEFSKFFAEKTKLIAEVMGRISSTERKRRQTYRGEVHGQLPFDNKGMDEPPPTAEITAAGQNDGLYSLSKEDIAVFMETLDQIERTTAVPPLAIHNTSGSDDSQPTTANQVLPHPLKETRAALEKLVTRIEGLSAEFDRLVERSVLSPDRLVRSKRRTESDASGYRDAIDQLREMREAQATREQAILDERESTSAEIRRLHRVHDESVRSSRDQANKSENEIASLRAMVERETTARASIEARHTELITGMEDKEHQLRVALAEATQKTKDAEVYSRELEQARLEAEEHHRLQGLNDEKLTSLLTEQAETLRKLEEARERGEDLEDQIKFARAEGDEAFRALNEATREKDRLLRTQSLEADRLLRDHIAEADGDRAVLEHQFQEMQAVREASERELKEALSQLDVCKADLVGTREELQRAQHEADEAEALNDALREELIRTRTASDDQTRRLTGLDHLLADMLDVAVSFRDTNARLFSATQKTLSQSARQTSKQMASLMDASVVVDHTALTTLTASTLEHRSSEAWATYATPIDWSDPATSIDILKGFDLESYSETVLKAVTTIRKWQKQCKEYRERARGKITFRNFTKGDLALFLPTRNSIAKPWAAFNVSFPHYFLKPTPQIVASLENREWIVARIISITERVVDTRDAATNPYGLGNGVKFYMLEVEEYAAQPPTAQRRAVSAPVRSPSPLARSEPSNGRVVSQGSPGISSIPIPRTQSSDSIEAPRPLNVSDKVLHNVGSPLAAGPSSLSRLLAQAGTAASPMEIAGYSASAMDASVELSLSPSSPPAPVVEPLPIPKQRHKRTGSNQSHSHDLIRSIKVGATSPSNTSSRPSTAVSNVPAYAIPTSPARKAPPSLAFADDSTPESTPRRTQHTPLPATQSSPSSQHSRPPITRVSSHERSTPSPAASASDGLSNVLLNRSRKRTISTKGLPSVASTGGPASSYMSPGSALASLASHWRIPLVNRARPRTMSSASISVSTPAIVDDNRNAVGSSAALITEEGVSENEESGVPGTVERGPNDARSLLRKLDSKSK